MQKIIAAAAFAMAASSSTAAVLDFSGNICNGGMACFNSAFVDQSYGSMTGVDVTYNGSDTAFDSVDEEFQYWSGTFGGAMTDVIITNASNSEIRFEAQTGYEVSLGGLDLGTFGANPAPGGISVAVIDLFDDSVLFSSGNLSVAGGGPINVAFNVSSTTGLALLFSGNLPNIGVDNISYDAVLTNAPMNPVPLPASAWLLGAGFLGLVGARRRRKA
jgi:hypothetical protein